jgi:Family of unknown function (DUF6527)
MKWWQNLLRCVQVLSPGGMPMATERCRELPDTPKPKTVYLIGENEYLWIAGTVCPCGCGAFLQMALVPEGHPRWTATSHWDGTTSLYPSVWRQKGCRSHFFLRHGKVNWC